jgi:hypothetical protein
VQWDVLASSDRAEAVLHQKEARIGINDPTVSCLRRRLDVAECWKESTESEPVSLLVSQAPGPRKRVGCIDQDRPSPTRQRVNGQQSTKHSPSILIGMIDYRRRLSSCDLSSVPEIRDVSQLLKKWGEGAREKAARSLGMLTSLLRLNYSSDPPHSHMKLLL